MVDDFDLDEEQETYTPPRPYNNAEEMRAYLDNLEAKQEAEEKAKADFRPYKPIVLPDSPEAKIEKIRNAMDDADPETQVELATLLKNAERELDMRGESGYYTRSDEDLTNTVKDTSRHLQDIAYELEKMTKERGEDYYGVKDLEEQYQQVLEHQAKTQKELSRREALVAREEFIFSKVDAGVASEVAKFDEQERERIHGEVVKGTIEQWQYDQFAAWQKLPIEERLKAPTFRKAHQRIYEKVKNQVIETNKEMF